MRGPGEDVDKREVRVCEGEPDGGVIDFSSLPGLPLMESMGARRH